MYAYQGVKQNVFITLLLMDMEVVFQFGTVMNSAAINNFVHILKCTHYPFLLGIYVQVELLDQRVHSALVDNYQTVFQSNYINSAFLPGIIKVLPVPHPSQHWYCTHLKMLAILVEM